tara:strand:- start:821 stop:1852 length:1032 start_codon:yes stop_codon:yes gene_type:complete
MLDEWYAFIMERAWIGVILCTIVLFGLPQSSVTAQDIPTPIGWEMGFVYADDATDGDPFPLENDGENTIRFWIRNDNLVGDIEVSLTYECDWQSDDGPCEVSGEETVTVGGGQNDTFSMKILDLTHEEMYGTAAGTLLGFEISGELTSLGPAPILAPVSSQNIEGDVIIPKLYRWEVNIVEIEHPISAGTEFTLEVGMKNLGNTADSYTSATIEDDCPVLTVDDEPLQELVGEIVQPSMEQVVDLVFDASSTHPTRLCEIEITVRSSGVASGGLGDSSNRDESVVNVEARPVGAQIDQDDANVGDDDGPQNQEQVTSDNFLIFPSLLTPLAMVSAALVHSRRK